jgi:hypothetical protein
VTSKRLAAELALHPCGDRRTLSVGGPADINALLAARLRQPQVIDRPTSESAQSACRHGITILRTCRFSAARTCPRGRDCVLRRLAGDATGPRARSAAEPCVRG